MWIGPVQQIDDLLHGSIVNSDPTVISSSFSIRQSVKTLSLFLFPTDILELQHYKHHHIRLGAMSCALANCLYTCHTQFSGSVLLVTTSQILRQLAHGDKVSVHSSQGYFSQQLGDTKVVVLDSDCDRTTVYSQF